MVTFPNAKINLGLSVLEKRPDGYHRIETIFYPIPLTDMLEIIPWTGPETVIQTAGLAMEGSPEDNSCLKAYRMMSMHFSLPPVRIFLYKTIPSGAGLGGGSSDAAFTIQTLNALFDLNAGRDLLLQIAVGVGSDCAFFLDDRPMLGTGRGECLEPVDLDLSGLRIMLVKPPCSVSTAEAYAGILPKSKSTPLKEIIALPLYQWQARLVNDFEESIFRKHAQIQTIKETLLSSGAVYASMTGSGSAVYGLFESSTPDPSLFPGCFVWTGVC
ncbi:MAG: 4-(cytidine 5'-diphospho)-2-C-methyl-D-erythritol kinase [Bacteroidales bacterium]|nr:4-(cytidine 5'-diphospho)-2-C-methyl-D-erythritol kinase [Bacteroidales bacterium]